MKVNDYEVLTDCIENGVNIGYRRAFKHTDATEEEINKYEQRIKESIYNEVLNEICNYFRFDFGRNNTSESEND